MSARHCSACDRPLRRGTSRRALVLSPYGELRSGLVCPRCALRSVTLVTTAPVTVAPPCAHCKAHPAAVCAECAAQLIRNVRGLSASNVALAAKHEANARYGKMGLPEGEKS